LFNENKKKYDEKRIDTEVHQFSTKYSATRMHHNIPHRFDEIINKIPNNKCVSCAEVIHFGKKSKKCSECGATIHPKCAHRLPNNCGLPVQLMQQIFNSSGDVHKDYYQSPRIDDIVEVHPEPSAPEESFVKYHSDSSATTDNNDDEDVFDGPALSTITDSPNLKEVQDICDNKESDNFSFSNSLLEILEEGERN
jgi:hypothetical protein